MSEDDESPRAQAGSGLIAKLSLSAAVVLLTTALLLAGKSALSAWFGTAGVPDRISGVDLHPWNSPGFVRWSAGVIALVLLVTLGRTWRDRRAGRPPQWRTVGGLSVLAVVWLAAFSTGLPAYYTAVMSTGPVSPVVPSAVGAWLLAAVGALAAVLGAVTATRSSRQAKSAPVGAGTAIALVVSVTVTALAFHAGDDARFIDATTAEAVEAPPYPEALGQHRFTLSLPDALADRDHTPLYEIRPAGAGFVVSHGGAITAYDAAGDQRWHYRRTGPAITAMGLRVYDGGDTVVVADYGGRHRGPATLVGLDAMTGEQLWKRRDIALSRAFASESGLYDHDPYLVSRHDDTWTRFDARTGRPMWTVPDPRGDCAEQEAANTASRLASVLRCDRDGAVDFRLVLVDPQTGEKSWEHPIVSVPADEGALLNVDVFAFPTGNEGIYLSAGSEDPRLSTDYYVNTTTMVVVPLPARADLETTTGPGEDFLLRRYDRETRGDVLSVYGPDGKLRCTTTAPLYPGGVLLPGRRQQDTAYLSLVDGFVLFDFSHDFSNRDGPSFLRMVSNTTCRPVSAQQIDAVLGLVAAPGVTLAIRQDWPNRPETVMIEGYA